MSKSKSIKKLFAIASLFIFLGMFFVFASNAFAADPIKYKAQIGFGEIFSKEIEIGPDSIGTYITEVYKYAVSVVGILASIVLMWGGVRWLTAGGDSGAIDDAKKWIEGALSGLVLVMTSYMILYFVNPDLIKFKSIKIDPVNAPAASQPTGPQYCFKFYLLSTPQNPVPSQDPSTECYNTLDQCNTAQSNKTGAFGISGCNIQ